MKIFKFRSQHDMRERERERERESFVNVTDDYTCI